MTTSLRSLLLGGVAVLAAAYAVPDIANAQTTDPFYGGGSSLAGKVYSTAGQIYYANNQTFDLIYETSSSGTGTSAFISNNDCLNYPGSVGCPATGTPSYVAASDAFLSASNYTAIAGSTIQSPAAGIVNVVQIPMFATPVAIAFNIPASVSSNFLTDGSVTLTDNDLGLIFSGHVTNWNDPSLSQNQPNVVLPNLAITVVYRSDGSGTSNLFTTHLANALTPTPTGSPQGTFYNANFAQGGAYPYVGNGNQPALAAGTTVQPVINQTGNNAFSVVFTASGGSVPGNFSAQSGSGGVQSKITSTAGAIGYLSPDYTDIAAINAGIAGFPPVASVNGVLPTVANTTSAFSGLPVPSTVAQLQNPENFAPLVPTPPSGSYPIVGYTYWFLDQCYASTNPARASDLVTFLSTFYNNSIYKTLVTNSGFSPISTGLGIGKVIKNNILANASGANIDIGDSTVCAGGVGR